MNFAVRRFRRSTDLPAAGFNFLRALLMSGVFYVMAGGRRDISVERVALNIEVPATLKVVAERYDRLAPWAALLGDPTPDPIRANPDDSPATV